MKHLVKLAGAVIASVLLVGTSCQAMAAQKKASASVADHKVGTKKDGSKKTADTRSTGKSGRAKSAQAAPSQTARTETSRSKSSTSSCKTVRVKTSRGTQTKRTCASAAPSEPLLTSNVDGDALTKSASGKEPEIKARTVPERAYAVDGETFFFQGRKFRLNGFTGESGSEMAKQRLQKVLDSGVIMVDPISVDASGAALASVRVNGRSIEDLLAQP